MLADSVAINAVVLCCCWSALRTIECLSLAEPGPTLIWRSKPPLIGPRRAEVDPEPSLKLKPCPRPFVRYSGQSRNRFGRLVTSYTCP
jgi:hypothetical protein